MYQARHRCPLSSLLAIRKGSLFAESGERRLEARKGGCCKTDVAQPLGKAKI